MKLNISLNVKLTHNAIIHSMNQESNIPESGISHTNGQSGMKMVRGGKHGTKKRTGARNEAKRVFE